MKSEVKGPSMEELMRKEPAELVAESARLRRELSRIRYALASGRLAKTHTLTATRRRLARTLTAAVRQDIIRKERQVAPEGAKP